MKNVKITIEQIGTDGKTRTHSNILPETAIESTQRIFGKEIKSIVAVDEDGNEMVIESSYKRMPAKSDVAFEAMKRRAQTLKIKGWQRMNEETLLKAIQNASIQS